MTVAIVVYKGLIPVVGRILTFKRAYHVTDFTSLPTEVRRYAGEITSNGSDFYWNLLLDYDWFYNYYFIKK